MPMEVECQLIEDNTPRLSTILAWKYAHMPAESVVKDLEINHLVKYSKGFVQQSFEDFSNLVAEVELGLAYDLPEDLGEISHISISRDGAHMPVCPSGWREAMCGTIGFYNKLGERLHGIYMAAAPQQGTVFFKI